MNEGAEQIESGKTVYFASNRPGGFGDNDLYESHLLGGDVLDGLWSDPVNLGPNVNSRCNDHMAMPSKDMKTLYISSARPGGIGGSEAVCGDEDIWVTRKDRDGNWRPLENLGPLVNSPYEDRCNYFTVDHRVMLFDSMRPGGQGFRDLWWVYTKNVDDVVDQLFAEP
jgi:hypothetical protein